MNTKLTQLLGCKYPIIQTAMGWVADANLVAANCNAGAFGFLAGAVMSPKEVEAGILEIKSKTDQPFGVNFHMYQAGAAQIIDLCVEHKVAAVSYSRSPDKVMIKKLKDAGIVCIPTVGAVKHAVKAVKMGADAIVIQGAEGGGHTGSVATTILLPQVIDALKDSGVPVVAAGGFSDGRGLVAALAFGADGIAMGTRFLMTKESPVPAQTKENYVKANPNQIIVSKKLDGLPQRMIMNKCLDDLEHAGPVSLFFSAIKNGLAYRRYTGQSLISLLQAGWKMKQNNKLTYGQTLMSGNAPMMIQEAMVRGNPSEGILPSGQIAGTIADLPDCASLISNMVSDAQTRLNALKAIEQ